MLLMVIKAANVSSAAAAVRFFPPIRCCSQRQQIPCRTASSATASTPAPPRQPLLLLLLLLLVSVLRKFLKVKNGLSVVMTSPSLSSLLHTRSMAECLCVGSMGGRELAVIMALVLSMTGHLRGRRSSAGCGGRRCCSNVLRELASFVSDRPTQQSNRTYIKKYPQNCCTWPVTHRSVSVFSNIWKYLVGYNSIRSPKFIWAVLTAVVSQIHTFLISDTTPGSITLQYSCMLYLP